MTDTTDCKVTEAADDERVSPFTDNDFVKVTGEAVVVTAPDTLTSGRSAHVFRPVASGADTLEYTGVLSEHGTWTKYDVLRTDYKPGVLEAVVSAGYSVQNAE